LAVFAVSEKGNDEIGLFPEMTWYETISLKVATGRLFTAFRSLMPALWNAIFSGVKTVISLAVRAEVSPALFTAAFRKVNSGSCATICAMLGLGAGIDPALSSVEHDAKSITTAVNANMDNLIA
jgi:hypothetical protein